MAWWRPEYKVETSWHVNKNYLQVSVVIENMYKYWFCYSNGDMSYKKLFFY